MPATLSGTIELSIAGMDCASCATHLEACLQQLPGVRSARVLIAASRAVIHYDPDQLSVERIQQAVVQAGYQVAASADDAAGTENTSAGSVPVRGFVGIALFVILTGIWENWVHPLHPQLHLPWWLALAGIGAIGRTLLTDVLRSARRGHVTTHTLLAVGVVASAAIGEWNSALLIVSFMRLAEGIEARITQSSREALRRLTDIRPALARVLHFGLEVAVPVAQVQVGDLIAVRSGERIPVDGRVVEGHVQVDESAITGESVPVEKAPHERVYAASLVQAGYLRIRAEKTGADTTFARIVRLVEEAEANKAPLQRLAQRFATGYLPFVIGTAFLSYLWTGRAESAVAVLVGACACSVALATPAVVLASVGRAGRQGLLIKGGQALEQLARVDTVVMDKTGTLTEGRPCVTDVVALDSQTRSELLRTLAGLETRSEHPLARGILRTAAAEGLRIDEPEQFQVWPGRGISGVLDGTAWLVGNRRLVTEQGVGLREIEPLAQRYEEDGKTLLFAARAGRVVGLVALADTLRPEVPAALQELRRLGVRRLVMLTGDGVPAARRIAGELELEYHAGLLPEEKLARLRALQQEGACVLMIGDGINDAPALAQADVGVAMGQSGSDVAIESADVALMRDDWSLVPEAVRIGRTAARTIRQNLAFSALYNVAVLATAGLGLLPAVWAAALHSLPDGVILLNSGRLLRTRRVPRTSVPPQPKPGKVALPVVPRHTHTHGNGPCHDHAHCHHHS